MGIIDGISFNAAVINRCETRGTFKKAVDDFIHQAGAVTGATMLTAIGSIPSTFSIRVRVRVVFFPAGLEIK
mgnify:CR=1 FL=1